MRGERLRLRIAAALFLPIAATAAARAEPPPASDGDRLTGIAALRPFFLALAGLEGGRTKRPVRIIQIGDSHTANDAFSGRLRDRLQARFGSAGRGWLPAGVPFKYFRPGLVAVTEAGWRHTGLRDAEPGAWLGLDAVTAEAVERPARMTMTSGEPEGFDRVAVEFVAEPHATRLQLRIDDGDARLIATTASVPGVRRYEALLPRVGRRVELSAPNGAGPAILGWSVERRRPGIIYENHGTIGATVGLLPRLAPAAVSFELGERQPALLVVAFGTNEGFDDALDLGRYAALFAAAVGELRRDAPGAAVLIVGPPDGNRRAKDCAGAAPAALRCGATDACAWGEPRNLAAVRQIQSRIARREGWAFWDWSAAMGGRCSIDRWFDRDPPLAMPDHVHLNADGYAVAADALFLDLVRGYDRWQRGRNRATRH